MPTIKNIEVSESQVITIDSIISTHRELFPTDEMNYNLSGLAKGGKILKIKTGEYWYYYKIMKSGAIAETRKSENDISYKPLLYFYED